MENIYVLPIMIKKDMLCDDTGIIGEKLTKDLMKSRKMIDYGFINAVFAEYHRYFSSYKEYGYTYNLIFKDRKLQPTGFINIINNHNRDVIVKEIEEIFRMQSNYKLLGIDLNVGYYISH